MRVFGFIVICIGIGLLISNYKNKVSFQQSDYTYKDIRRYQKKLIIYCIIVLYGLICLLTTEAFATIFETAAIVVIILVVLLYKVEK